MLLTDPASEFGTIAAVIESDPALTVALLTAANSAASASLARVESAQQAIVRLGMAPTRQIVAGAVVGQTFRQLERAQLEVDALWRHLVAIALLSDAAAGPETDGSAFTAGLLHDLGRLAMAADDPERYTEVVVRARAGLDTLATEAELFGSDHASLGYEIADAWDLPAAIAEAILNHHRDGGTSLSAAVQQARRVGLALGFGNGVTTPREPHLDLDSEDAEIVRRVGGPRELNARIEWYRGAIQGGSG